MTATFSAALRMPHTASVAIPAPRALGVSAEPFAMRSSRLKVDGIIAPTSVGRLGGSGSSGRFGGGTRSIVGVRWYRQDQDQVQLAGGGPLRG